MWRPRMTVRFRALALEAGVYQQHDGTMVLVREMADEHLVQAFICALTEGEPPSLTRHLAEEVARRKLEDRCREVARQRVGKGGAVPAS